MTSTNDLYRVFCSWNLANPRDLAGPPRPAAGARVIMTSGPTHTAVGSATSRESPHPAANRLPAVAVLGSSGSYLAMTEAFLLCVHVCVLPASASMKRFFYGAGPFKPRPPRSTRVPLNNSPPGLLEGDEARRVRRAQTRPPVQRRLVRDAARVETVRR